MVVDHIEQNIYFGKHVLAVLLDIQAAFDTINPTHIKDALHRKGIPEEITDWYYNYITHRNIEVNINDVTINQTIRTGFPQGGICSAKFWIIAYDKRRCLVGHTVTQASGGLV